jgi:hypothetical protein
MFGRRVHVLWSSVDLTFVRSIRLGGLLPSPYVPTKTTHTLALEEPVNYLEVSGQIFGHGQVTEKSRKVLHWTIAKHKRPHDNCFLNNQAEHARCQMEKVLHVDV